MKREFKTPRCPACRARDLVDGELPPTAARGFYALKVRICRRCKCVWETEPEPVRRFDETFPWKEPCDNCAFRPGSPELEDKAAWTALLEKLKAGAGFYCHKGVPIDPTAEHGFRYPKDEAQLRLCAGFLAAVKGWEKKDSSYRWLCARYGIAPDAAEGSEA